MISAVAIGAAVLALQVVVEPPKAKPVAIPTPEQLAKRFEDLVWQPPTSFGGGPYRYRLHIPKECKNRRLPLLVWIHGKGEGGTDNVRQLDKLHLVLTDPNDLPPLYILAWQRPRGGPWAETDSKEKQSSLTILDGLLQHVLDTYPIDANRIYLTGLCEGGTACWEYASRHPKRFAALAPMAPFGDYAKQAAIIKNIPTWTFYSTRDTEPSDDAEHTVEALQKAGGFACLTKVTDRKADPHDCWTVAFRDYDLTHWMLAQRRGEIVWWPPGWPWWQGPMWFGVGTFLLIGWVFDRGRRMRQRVRREQEQDENSMSTDVEATTSTN